MLSFIGLVVFVWAALMPLGVMFGVRLINHFTGKDAGARLFDAMEGVDGSSPVLGFVGLLALLPWTVILSAWSMMFYPEYREAIRKGFVAFTSEAWR